MLEARPGHGEQATGSPSVLTQTPVGRGWTQGRLGTPHGETCSGSGGRLETMTFSWSLGQGCPGLTEGLYGGPSSPSAPIHIPSHSHHHPPAVFRVSHLTLPRAPSCCPTAPQLPSALDTEPTKALPTGFITSPSAALCPPIPPNNSPMPRAHHGTPRPAPGNAKKQKR